MEKFKINARQLPVKAHFFFFMGAMGPILPFVSVYGKQLGISPMVMGTVTAILPILYLISKPLFGYLLDYFYSARKFIFVGLLSITSLAFVFMYFLPSVQVSPLNDAPNKFNVASFCNNITNCSSRNASENSNVCGGETRSAECRWSCNNDTNNYLASVIFSNRERNFSLESLCLVNSTDKTFFCDVERNNSDCKFSCDYFNERCLYRSLTFWSFVILTSIGLIGFNVSNSVSDAICFDVLGKGGEMSYGRQRLWGTIGFGITALLAGYVVDEWSAGQVIKDYTPAFILVLTFTCFDILCCTKLELPLLENSISIAKDVYALLKLKPIIIFLCFATLAGICDSFIIYFLFWYLEDLAEITGHMDQIKLIEGLIIAAETLGGEVIFFSLSGKILKKLGHGYTFVFCFFCYALRLSLISIVANPWWVIPIELFMQGPSYALCYTNIVAFASIVAPVGTSATVQGIVAGMDDGFGFALGSLLGGLLYKTLGGALSLRVFSFLAGISSISYLILHVTYLKHAMPDRKIDEKSKNIQWKSPEEAAKDCHVESES